MQAATFCNEKIFEGLHSANEILLKNIVILARYYYPNDQFVTVSAESSFISEMHTIREAYLRKARVEVGGGSDELGTDHHAFSLFEVHQFLMDTLFDLVIKCYKKAATNNVAIDMKKFVATSEAMPNLFESFKKGRLNALKRLQQVIDDIPNQ